MCRYAFKTYKPHYVCFACRKQFKRPRIDDVMAHLGKLHLLEKLERARSRKELEEAERTIGTTRKALSAQYHSLVSRCPQCGGEMADLGLDFKPPPMSALRVWHRLRTVHRMGHHWRTCGCNGPGFVPTTRPEMLRYLAERSETYGQNAEWARRDQTKTPEARAEAHAYWTECRNRVDRERAAIERGKARG